MKRKMHSSVLSCLLVAITLFFAAACNSGNNGSSADNAGNKIDNQKNDTINHTSVSRVDTVIIKMMKFQPADIQVNKGDTIVWINEGIVPHDVTEFPDKAWTSDTLKVGASWKKVIDESFDYFCSIHITMKGKVTVKP